MLLPRRVVGRDVQGREVMPVVLDVGAFHNPEPHFAQDRYHLVEGLADGMNPAIAFRPDGKGDIHFFAGKPGIQFGIGQGALACLDGLGDFVF